MGKIREQMGASLKGAKGKVVMDKEKKLRWKDYTEGALSVMDDKWQIGIWMFVK